MLCVCIIHVPALALLRVKNSVTASALSLIFQTLEWRNSKVLALLSYLWVQDGKKFPSQSEQNQTIEGSSDLMCAVESVVSALLWVLNWFTAAAVVHHVWPSVLALKLASDQIWTIWERNEVWDLSISLNNLYRSVCLSEWFWVCKRYKQFLISVRRSITAGLGFLFSHSADVRTDPTWPLCNPFSLPSLSRSPFLSQQWIYWSDCAEYSMTTNATHTRIHTHCMMTQLPHASWVCWPHGCVNY